MATRDTSELKATLMKLRSNWKSLVPGYEQEVIEKALANPLLDFAGCRHIYVNRKTRCDKF